MLAMNQRVRWAIFASSACETCKQLASRGSVFASVSPRICSLDPLTTRFPEWAAQESNLRPAD
jgi:hypothetical protein